MKKQRTIDFSALLAKTTESVVADVMTTAMPEELQLVLLKSVADRLNATWAAMTGDDWDDDSLYSDD